MVLATEQVMPYELQRVLEQRRAIGWSFVHFFLLLSGRAWEDLPPSERFDCWAVAEEVR